jgi:hypothetical protein
LPDLVQAWPTNYDTWGYHVHYQGCNIGVGQHFAVSIDLPSKEPQLICDIHPIEYDDEVVRSARQHRAWINRGIPPGTGDLTLEHHCLDAGGIEPGTLTHYQITGPGGFVSRDPSLFTQYGAEAVGEWGSSAMLWSLAGYHGFGFASAHMTPETDPPTPPQPEEYDKKTFLKFCPEAAINPAYPALRWRKMGDAAWAKNPPGEDMPEYRHYTIIDIDGDGYADLLTDTITPAEADLFKRAGVRFSRKIARLESTLDRPGPGLYPFSTFGGEAVTITPTAGWSFYADITGDGIVDLITANDWTDAGIPHVRPGDGRGGFGCDAAADITCHVAGNGSWLGNAFRLSSPDRVKPWPIHGDHPFVLGSTTHFFHDVTGDGLADLIAYTPPSAETGPDSVGRIQLWVNVDGRQFRCAQPSDCVVGTITGDDQPGRRGGPVHRVVFTDLDANGTEDFVLFGFNGVWSFSFLAVEPVPPAGPRSPRPGLLTRINNGIGAETEIVYQTIQELEAAFTDADSTSFHAPWTTHVPVVLPIVTRIARRDSRSAAGGASCRALPGESHDSLSVP